MPYPHVIRLRGPWEYEPLARFTASADGAPHSSTADLPPSGRQPLPADWDSTLGSAFRGRVRYRRRFNRPTGLEAAERVWLAIDGVDACGSYALNGQSLGTIAGYALPAASDVTDLLAAANVLEIDVELAPSMASGSPQSNPHRPGRERRAGGAIGDVRLEIRGPAHVEGLAVYWEPGPGLAEPARLCVAGRAVGAMPDERFSVAIIGCEREIAYCEVAAGATFAASAPIEDWPAWPDPYEEAVLTPVEIRLIAGGRAVWQTVCQTAPPQSPEDSQRRAILGQIGGDGPSEWFDYLAEGDAVLSALIARGAGKVIGLRGIMNDAVYSQLDRANVAVVQLVPPSWAAIVCPRLAHHPSIVAWGARAAEDSSALEAVAFGRPWIAIS